MQHEVNNDIFSQYCVIPRPLTNFVRGFLMGNFVKYVSKY